MGQLELEVFLFWKFHTTNHYPAHTCALYFNSLMVSKTIESKHLFLLSFF